MKFDTVYFVFFSFLFQPTGDSVEIAKHLHAKYRSDTRGEFFRKLAVAAKAPRKPIMQSALSWKRGGDSLRFAAGQEEEFMFEEVQVEESFVVAG